MRGPWREFGDAFKEGQVGLDGGFVELYRKHILCAALTTFSTFVTFLLCITIPTSSLHLRNSPTMHHYSKLLPPPTPSGQAPTLEYLRIWREKFLLFP